MLSSLFLTVALARAAEPEPDLPPEVSQVLRGHNRMVGSLAFSADGKYLASASWDNHLCLWKLGNKAKLWAKVGGSPSGLAFSPDGKILAAGTEDTSVILWDVTGAEPRKRDMLAGHRSRPFALTFNRAGNMLVTGSGDPVLRLWKLAAGAEPEAWGVLANESAPSRGISALSFSSDGKLLAAGSLLGEATLRLWKIGPYLEELAIPKAKARLVAFSPREPLLAFADKEAAISLWDVRDSAKPSPLATVDAPAAVTALAFAADGKTLAYTCKNKRLGFWNRDTRKATRAVHLPSEATALDWSAGEVLALGNNDGTIFLWRAKK